jgi:tetratricopeptide (TPR) repeat protein
MLNGVEPSVALGRDTTMLREILDQTAERVGKDLTHQPAVEAELQNTLGTVYNALGDYAKAEAIHREALALRRKLLGNEHPDVATSLNNLASVLREAGKPAEAETTCREALALRRKLFGNDHPDVAESLDIMGNLVLRRGSPVEAETICREALAIKRKLFGNEHTAVAISLGNVADVPET